MSPIQLTDISDAYDYIVCGGGTSGCVVAGRLAEDSNVSILLVEAGPHNENLENTHMVGGWANNFDSNETDWNIITEPAPGIDNRSVKLSRGKFLGGCSGCNGTLVIRGSRDDYDSWDIPGWSGEEMFKYMSKAETFHGKPWFEADTAAHGHNGPLHIEPHDPAPITKLLLESFQSQGFPLDHDMFSHGKRSHGCGHAPRTVHQGIRTTGADFVTKGYHRDSIDILVSTTVVKVVIEKTEGGLQATGLQATGVDLVGKDGEKRIIKAKKEVIVSGGAYCSPAILLRSGIGPREELQENDIECLIDLPGVGKNLMDHLVGLKASDPLQSKTKNSEIVFVFYETEVECLTNDHLVYHDDALSTSYQLWKDTKSGFLSTFPFGAFAFARLDDRLKDEPLWRETPRKEGRDPMDLTSKQPHVEFFSTEAYGGPKQYDDFPIDHKHAFSMISELFSPRSKGTVTLRSANALENPVVDNNYLADPLDLLVLSEAVRLGNEIVTKGSGTKKITTGSWPSNLTHHKHTKREEWVPYVKQHATTCYHPGGTCKMGRDEDKLAVLDEKLCVRGVKGLRVADTSVMPTLNNGHTQMPAYGIGEKAADLIKADRRD